MTPPRLTLYLGKSPEELAEIYEKITGKKIPVEKVRAALSSGRSTSPNPKRSAG